jgi:hypothetical protein
LHQRFLRLQQLLSWFYFLIIGNRKLFCEIIKVILGKTDTDQLHINICIF